MINAIGVNCSQKYFTMIPFTVMIGCVHPSGRLAHALRSLIQSAPTLCFRIKKKSVARLLQRICTGSLAAGSAPARRSLLHSAPSLATHAPHRWLLRCLRHHPVPYLHPPCPSRKGRHAPAPALALPSTSHVGRKGGLRLRLHLGVRWVVDTPD
jgi:hypothetical protein